jgi:hypothetical protein
VAWIVPNQAWWETFGHRETIDHRPSWVRQPSIWQSVVDEDALDYEDEDMLDALDAIGDDEDDPARSGTIPCWTAQLQSERGLVASTGHQLTPTRDDLVTLIRWLTVHGPSIPDGTGTPPTPAKKVGEWEENFGSRWWLPEDPSTCAWYRFGR